MQWSGEASRLLKTIGALADRNGNVPIALLSDYTSTDQAGLLQTLRAMADARIITLDEKAENVSVPRS